MEERFLKVSLEKAKEWYNSGNEALEKLALNVFKKGELVRPTYEEICLVVGGMKYSDISTLTLKLMVLAKYYFKKGDDFSINHTKYFIGRASTGELKVMTHCLVCYPGLPYFKREADAKEALQILFEYMDKHGKV